METASLIAVSSTVVFVGVLAGAMGPDAAPVARSGMNGTVAGGAIGPDVIAGHCSGTIDGGSMNGPMYWGMVGETRAFSVGSVSCNVGDAPLNWIDEEPTPTLHPVIGQSIYRLKPVDGTMRFEQIGMSWVKHGFCALQQELCSTCTPAGNGCADQLGVGCSDPYDPFLNGFQFRLGPRSEINAATGEVLVWPYTPAPITDVTQGRVQINDADLDPALNSKARYFAEIQYVAADDAAAGNATNNASYRECNVVGPDHVLPYIAETVRESPALFAWRDIDPAVTIANVDVPDDGRFHLAYQVTDLGDGTWRYEYALHNLNSDRSGRALTVPADVCVTITNAGWHGVPHHSGEIYAVADWIEQRTANAMMWTTDSFETDPLANALRWGTQFNYRFDADAPPVAGTVDLALFKPGTDSVIAIPSLVPGGAQSPLADCGDDGDTTVDVIDLLALLSQWGEPGSCDIDPAGGDGTVGITDLLLLLSAWGETGCS